MTLGVAAPASGGTVASKPLRLDRESTSLTETLAADRWVKVVILAAGYTLTGIVGLSLAIPPGYATAVWPPPPIPPMWF